MTTPVWPTGLPQKPIANQWVGGPQKNKVSFQPELGPTIDRRRGSAAGEVFQATFDVITDAGLQTFKDFFRTDLLDGVLAFQWVDPIDGDTANWKFIDDPPYQVRSGRYQYHQISFKLLKLP